MDKTYLEIQMILVFYILGWLSLSLKKQWPGFPTLFITPLKLTISR